MKSRHTLHTAFFPGACVEKYHNTENITSLLRHDLKKRSPDLYKTFTTGCFSCILRMLCLPFDIFTVKSPIDKLRFIKKPRNQTRTQ